MAMTIIHDKLSESFKNRLEFSLESGELPPSPPTQPTAVQDQLATILADLFGEDQDILDPEVETVPSPEGQIVDQIENISVDWPNGSSPGKLHNFHIYFSIEFFG